MSSKLIPESCTKIDENLYLGIILLQDPAFALPVMQHVLMLPVILAFGN